MSVNDNISKFLTLSIALMTAFGLTAAADSFEFVDEPEYPLAEGDEPVFAIEAVDADGNKDDTYDTNGVSINTIENNDVDENIDFSNGEATLDLSAETSAFQNAVFNQRLEIEEGEISGESSQFDVYEESVALDAGWSAFSAPEVMTEDEGELAGDGTILEYKDGWQAVEESEMVGEPLRAYFLSDGYSGVYFNVNDSFDESFSVELQSGWNFIGGYDNNGHNLITTIFSPVEHVLNSLVYPEQNRDGATLGDLSDDGTLFNYLNDLDDQNASAYDGYWLRASGEETLSIAPQPEE